MHVLIASDTHIGKKQNRYYAKIQVYTILESYYKNFGKIKLCCRVDTIEDDLMDYHDIAEWVDTVIPVTSLSQMLIGGYNNQLMHEMRDCDLIVGRCPSFSAYQARNSAHKIKKPYYAEVMGCAWDAYWNHSLVGKLIAPYMFLKMRNTVRQADYALYVTNSFLQKRYPCNGKHIGVSNVRIDDISQDLLVKRLEAIHLSDQRELCLMTTAAIDVRYKGQEYMIRAIPLLNDAGIRIHYKLAGGGSSDYLHGLAEKLGVSDQVEFLGRLSREQVMQHLDSCDIYVHPSLQEGLPRAVVEAMSRGCPVVGAKTGGIPELIAPECVFARKSEKAIADTILSIWDKEKLLTLAEKNFESAREYREDVLTERRAKYFSRIQAEIESK